jgi:hypothetical protein
MQNRLSSIQPDILDQHLPGRALYFVLKWGFSLQFAHAAFVHVEEFQFGAGHALQAPIYLNATLHPDVLLKPDPTHDIAIVEDAEGGVLCHAEITRTDERWQARLRAGVNVVGRAQGTLGAKTSSQLIGAALVALVRQAGTQGV